MIISEEDYLMHYGVLRRSGRYPWGSGGPENASNKGFLGMIEAMRKDGMTEAEIAKSLDITTTALRAAKSIATNEERAAQIAQVHRMKEKGMSNMAIGQELGINESSVRSLLNAESQRRTDILQSTADMLKRQVDEKGFIDIGSGTENHLDITATKLKTAVAMLEEQGYTKYNVVIDQLGTNNKTKTMVLAPPGTTYRDVVTNKDKIKTIVETTDDGGASWNGLLPPLNVSSKRIGINYAEDGGADADGLIYVRPGVSDLSLGGRHYAQVRIAVDGTHYLKGMALYKDDLPEGTDLVFNTNKSNTGKKTDAMKAMKDDPENPFGSVVRQQFVPTPGGGRKLTSAMNLVNDEDSWETWSKSLSTQLLSKQSVPLARQQLDETYARRRADLDEIKSLTNPAVKRKLLESYADGADSSAIHLKAAALPRQKTHVILPINTLKDTEVYAPNYRNGERVVLIRYPHGGTFEIPELTVNNRHADARKLIGDATTAIGINAKVAGRMSGADFDGDTVLVIPNNGGMLKSSKPLEKLKGFDPQAAYPKYEGMKLMDDRTMQFEMGMVSNLITDMTIRGANNDELARAVRHSMVVIDAKKHKLNYKQSALDNGISSLQKKYQPRADGRGGGGSSTLISRATSPVRVEDRPLRKAKDGGPIDPKTGKLVYESTPRSFVNRDGQTVIMKRPSVKLAETDNAHTLSSGTDIERVYADHSNRLKALANEARREYVGVQSTPYSPSAKAVYRKEVDDLNAALNLAMKNRPLERQAQIVAGHIVRMKQDANPDMEKDELKKIKSQALAQARIRTGAAKSRITISDKQWEAIQAGAITNHKLEQILANTDLDRVKELAQPRTKTLMTGNAKARAQAMAAQGYTQSEIADALGVSLTTLKTGLSE